MKGRTHLTIGIIVGAATGYITEPNLLTVATGASIGGISSLAPDLDTNGIASNRITFSKQTNKKIMQIITGFIFLAIVYETIKSGLSRMSWTYLGIYVLIYTLSKLLSTRRRLTLAGIAVVILGVILQQSIGIMLVGSYIIIASFLPHRSYTHSIIGLAFYALILHQLQQDWQIKGLFTAGIAGYTSHLIADMKLLPVNRKGVKLFAPIWNKEF